jgi:DNA-binding IclR family transcriptional regulator
MGITELATALELPIDKVSAVIARLEAEGFLVNDGDMFRIT